MLRQVVRRLPVVCAFAVAVLVSAGMAGWAGRATAQPATSALDAPVGRVIFGRTGVPGPRPPATTTLHTAWGVFPADSAGTGLAAVQSVVPNLTLSGSEYLYAPTLMAPSGSCAELTTGYTPDGAYLWAWDWCHSDGPAKTVPIDNTFVATYTTSVHGHPAYRMRELRTDTASNTWTIYLYNYQTNAWDVFYQQSGKNILGVDYGWDMFEVYTTPPDGSGTGAYCAAIAGHAFESSDIQLYNASTGWTPATPANAPGLDPVPTGASFDCPTLRFSVPTANSDWLAGD